MKKVISCLLAVLMVLTLFPAMVFARTTNDSTTEVAVKEKLKEQFDVLFKTPQTKEEFIVELKDDVRYYSRSISSDRAKSLEVKAEREKVQEEFISDLNVKKYSASIIASGTTSKVEDSEDIILKDSASYLVNIVTLKADKEQLSKIIDNPRVKNVYHNSVMTAPAPS